MSIKNEALNRAIRLLEVIGCEYKIKFEGVFHGGLVINPVEVPPKKRQKMRPNPRYLMMKNVASKMVIGDTNIFVCEAGEGAVLRGNLTCYISKLWGKGNYISSLNHHKDSDDVTIFRVG